MTKVDKTSLSVLRSRVDSCDAGDGSECGYKYLCYLLLAMLARYFDKDDKKGGE